MKTKMMKRAAAFAASVLMTAAMAVPAAADAEKTTHYKGNDAYTTMAKEMTIVKKIKMYNADKLSIYEPNITYKYTVGEGPAGQTITAPDMSETNPGIVTVKVKAGEAGDILLIGTDAASASGKDTAYLEFGDDSTIKITGNGSEATRDLKIKIDETKFASKDPGVYRYKLTQAVDTPTTMAAAGVDDGDELAADYAEMYLDVYVDAEHNVYGMVLSKDDVSYEYDAAGTGETKIYEFDPDEYHTFNLEVTKTITGSMAKTDQPFDFTIDLANSTVTSNDEFDVTGKIIANDVTFTDGAYQISVGLADGEFVKIIGLPTGTTAGMKEVNTTDDSYTASAVDNAGNVPATAKVFEGMGDTYAAFASGYPVTKDDAGNKVDFTNSLEKISPTGVLFRMAPYALMMTAGGVLIVVYLRGKKREDAESMI